MILGSAKNVLAGIHTNHCSESRVSSFPLPPQGYSYNGVTCGGENHEAESMNCNECETELITEDGEMNEYPRYGGLCADCFVARLDYELEEQINALLDSGADFVSIEEL